MACLLLTVAEVFTAISHSTPVCRDAVATNYVSGAPRTHLWQLHSYTTASYRPRYSQGCGAGCAPSTVNSHGCSISGGVTGSAGGPTAYSGVEPGTPMYQGLTVGVPLRHAGQVTYAAYPSVVATDAAANTLDGSCVVAIEGCMDSNAPNYDPKATVNTNTWCIPAVTGCMMPATGNAGAGNYQGAADHSHQGLALNFNPAATIQSHSTSQLSQPRTRELFTFFLWEPVL